MKRLIIVFGVIVAVLGMIIAYSANAHDQPKQKPMKLNAGIITTFAIQESPEDRKSESPEVVWEWVCGVPSAEGNAGGT